MDPQYQASMMRTERENKKLFEKKKVYLNLFALAKQYVS
jgi:hypothetical protein